MATRNEVISYGPFPAPQGTVIGSIVITFVGSNPANNQSQTVTPGTATVTATLADDSYTVHAQAFDSATPPNPVGPAATESFTILTTTTVQIPVSLSGTTV
jgi:hypothetical protein